MSEPDDIADEALRIVVSRADLAGLRVCVTAGGTREPLDLVRFLGNRSSGRQGVALAVAAAERGADVELVAAHIEAEVLAPALGSPRIRVARAGTALEMQAAASASAAEADVVVMAAAVADYRPARTAEEKLTKEASGDRLVLELVENPDIVAGLAAARPAGQTVVAFAAETASGPELDARAERKRARKGVDLLVVNRVGWDRGFEVADNEVAILGADGVAARASGTKRAVADAVWDAVLTIR